MSVLSFCVRACVHACDGGGSTPLRKDLNDFKEKLSSKFSTHCNNYSIVWSGIKVCACTSILTIQSQDKARKHKVLIYRSFYVL